MAIDVEGKTVCITGKFTEVDRKLATAHLQSLGAKVGSSVSKKTDMLFAGAKAGSKLAKANKLGIPVHDESALMAVLNASAAPTLAAPEVIEASGDATPFSGKTIVLTGTFGTMKRSEAKKILIVAGATIGGSVGKKTDLLIHGADAGSKLAKANKLGVATMTDREMVALLEGKSSDETPTDWLSRFDKMVAELKAHPKVDLLNVDVGKPVKESKVASVEKILGAKLPPALRSFYLQCNGLSLRWIHKNNEEYDRSAPVTSRRLSMGELEDGADTGCILILPIEEVFFHDYESLFGFKTRHLLDCFHFFHHAFFLFKKDDGTALEEPIVVMGEDYGVDISQSLVMDIGSYLELLLGTYGCTGARQQLLHTQRSNNLRNRFSLPDPLPNLTLDRLLKNPKLACADFAKTANAPAKKALEPMAGAVAVDAMPPAPFRFPLESAPPTLRLRHGLDRGIPLADLIPMLLDAVDLDLGHSRIDDEVLSAIAALPALESLKLHNCPNITSAGVASLAGCASLRKLEVWHSNDDVLSTLATLTQLTDLWVLGPEVTDDSLAVIAQLPSLEQLSIRSCVQVGDEGLAHIAGMVGLKRLSMSATMVSDSGFDHLVGLTALEELEAARLKGKFGGRGLAKLAKLPALHTVDLSGNKKLKDTPLKKLAKMPALRNLDLSSCEAIRKGLGHLGASKTLETLKVTYCKDLDASSFDGLAASTTLRQANFTGIKSIDDTAVGHLAAIPSIRELNFVNCSVTDDGIRALVAHGQISSLKLGCPPNITAAGIEALSGLASLRVLTLNGWDELNDAALASLANLIDLEELEFGTSYVTDATIEALQGLTSLRSLVFGTAKITGKGLGKFQSLEVLNVSSCLGMTEAGWAEIATLSKLRRMSAGRAPVSDAALATLASAPLEMLYVTAGASGASWIAAYADHPTLKKIQALSNDWLNDAALSHMANIPGLVELDIRYVPNITCAGVATLAALPRLDRLDVANNKGLLAKDAAALEALAGLPYLGIRKSPVAETLRHRRATGVRLT